MNAIKFREMRRQAVELHASQKTEKEKVSLDAVFMALVSEDAAGMRTARDDVRKTTEEQPPDWFNDTLNRLKGTGEKITVGRFLLLAGQFPSTRSDALKVSGWLKEAGFMPRKTGGQQLFEL